MPDRDEPVTHRAVYWCVNQRCPQYHHETHNELPSVVRAWTGGPLKCGRCGDVLRYLRQFRVAS